MRNLYISYFISRKLFRQMKINYCALCNLISNNQKQEGLPSFKLPFFVFIISSDSWSSTKSIESSQYCVFYSLMFIPLLFEIMYLLLRWSSLFHQPKLQGQIRICISYQPIHIIPEEICNRLGDVHQNRCSWKFRNIHKKTPVLGSLFNKLTVFFWSWFHNWKSDKTSSLKSSDTP